MPLLRFPAPVAVPLGHWPRSAAAAPAGSVEDLAAATIRDLGLQVDLPRWLPLPHFALRLPDAIAWLAAGVALAVLLYCLKDWRWRRATDAAEPGAPPAETIAPPTDHLASAEAYARAGLFALAMHEVLLEALRAVRAAAGDRMPDSLTSREILRHVPLPEPGRASLRAIVAGVEWTHFGARFATLADYHACRQSLDALHSALRGTAGA